MKEPGKVAGKAEKLLRESRVAVAVVKKRMRLVAGWQALQERDKNGQPKGPLPYSDVAMTEFNNALAEDPENPDIIHHLAIATHARAWDLELQDDPKAAAEWERALGHWRAVISSSSFWDGFREKLMAIDPAADPALITTLRSDLYEQLLDIHVDFIRRYFEGNNPNRAAVHVGIIGRARIPPAVRARLTDKLFAAMTVSVAQARAMQEFEAALGPVEQFLALFKTHLPALQAHAEICRDWVTALSYSGDWQKIVSLYARAEPYAKHLAGHDKLTATPLAKSVLEELAIECMRKAKDRGNHHLALLTDGAFSQTEHDEAEWAFEQALAWGRCGMPASTSGSGLRLLLASALNDRMILCLKHEMPSILESDIDLKAKLNTQIFLFKKCIVLLEEAVQVYPEDTTINSNLQGIRKDLEKMENLAKLLGH